MLGFGVVVAAAMVAGLPASALPTWRLGLAALLAFDIGAGCVANFTRSTSDYYAARPSLRWVFLAVHVHVPALAWALGQSLTLAGAVWAFTIVSGSLVNLWAGRPTQRFVGGLLLACGCAGVPLVSAAPPSLVAVYLLFVLKVQYAFAVDHYGSGKSQWPLSPSRTSPTSSSSP